MEFKKFKIKKNSKEQIQKPFIRASNMGCEIRGCNCSPKNFLSISDGKTGIFVQFSNQEMEKFKEMFIPIKFRFSLIKETKKKELI